MLKLLKLNTMIFVFSFLFLNFALPTVFPMEKRFDMDVSEVIDEEIEIVARELLKAKSKDLYQVLRKNTNSVFFQRINFFAKNKNNFSLLIKKIEKLNPAIFYHVELIKILEKNKNGVYSNKGLYLDFNNEDGVKWFEKNNLTPIKSFFGVSYVWRYSKGAYSFDEKYFLKTFRDIQSNENKLNLFKESCKEPVCVFDDSKGYIYASFSKDGRCILTISCYGDAKVWQILHLQKKLNLKELIVLIIAEKEKTNIDINICKFIKKEKIKKFISKKCEIFISKNNKNLKRKIESNQEEIERKKKRFKPDDCDIDMMVAK